MENLVDAFPDLAAELINGLTQIGRPELINDLQKALVLGVSFDDP
jgi:hypothetical protein